MAGPVRFGEAEAARAPAPAARQAALLTAGGEDTELVLRQARGGTWLATGRLVYTLPGRHSKKPRRC